MHSLFARLHARFGTPISSEERRARRESKVAEFRSRFAAADEMLRSRATELSAKPRAHVVIIGAGFAGLMAGRELAPHCDVTIFEARDRVGGRVWSKSQNNHVIEAGGELIGYNHPLWLTLAKEYELGLSVLSTDSYFEALGLGMPLYLNGTMLNDQQQKDVYRDMDATFHQMGSDAAKINPDRPWDATNASHLDKMPLSRWIGRLGYKFRTNSALEQQFSNDGGAPTDQQSYLANLAIVAGGALKHDPSAFFTQTEALRCSEGNQELATRLAQTIKDQGGKIEFSNPVTAIQLDGKNASVKPEHGTAVDADYAILAIPPSLFPGSRFAKLTIHPGLPRKYYLTMGTAVKYLSPLQRRFWIGEHSSPLSTSDEFGVTWEGTDNQIAAPGEDVELSLFAGGQVAQDALRAFDSGGQPGVQAFYKTPIENIYPGYGASVAQPQDFIAWPRDKWTGAGYSCPAPGDVCTAGKALSEPFEKRLFFAGEHTCPAFYGYMEGALQSGKTVASTILKLI
jgi:monoamine oxidase